MFDPRGTIADDVIELLFELVEHTIDAITSQRILVTGLRRREYVEVVVTLVFDQRLIEVGVAIDDVDEIKDDPAFAPHDQIEVAQTDIEVDDDSLVPAQREPGGKRRRGGGLAHPALA